VGDAVAGDESASTWRLVETALALAALLGLAAGVYLSHHIVTLFGASAAENQTWSVRRASYASMHQHAADIVAPGNDIFQLRNAHTRKFFSARAVLNQALTDARRELVQNVPRSDAKLLLKDFAALRRAVKPLVAEVRNVFRAFRQNDVELAVRRQGLMNRKATALRAAFGTLDRHLSEVEGARLGSQAKAAERLAVLWRWIAGLLLAGVGSMLVYGRRAGRRSELLAAEQRRTVVTLRESESELAEARDRALEAARLKSEFVANMSHEIRTPMNIVFGMADMLLDSPLSVAQREHVQALRRNAEGLLRIIDDVLDFSKIEAGKLVLESIPLSLRRVVTDAVATLAPRASGKGLTLDTRFRPDVPDTVLGDPTRLRQVLLNLTDNAIKFTEQGSVTVEIAVETAAADEVVVRFAVIDTGIGVSPEMQARIFEAFTQADGTTTRRFGGTGLGLTISLQLVTLMSGRLWLESELGRGSAFHFTLPMHRVAVQPVRLRKLGGAAHPS